MDRGGRMNRIKFVFDKSIWVFPICLRLTCVGCDNRLYTVSIDVLCFRFILCIDEDSY